ncbi:MAG TPA: DinB family protein [Blastocatellia bacterium]|nr:DinB family protein [Blastocatellia bacterium]
MKHRIHVLRYLVSTFALSCALSLVGFAQAASGNQQTPATPLKEWPKDRLGSIAAEWTRAKNWTKEYIDKMPEDGMSFKPVPEVRSFAEQMLHLAAANFFYGVRGTGATNPYQGKNLEKMDEFKTKTALTKVVMESYDFVINNVTKLDPAKLEERQPARGMNIPRAEFLVMGFEHQTHHRGQTTIYLRMKGVTPPPEPF